MKNTISKILLTYCITVSFILAVAIIILSENITDSYTLFLGRTMFEVAVLVMLEGVAGTIIIKKVIN